MIPRVPNTVEQIKEMLKGAEENPEIGVKRLYERHEDALDMIRKKHPGEYASGEATWGKMAWEEFMLALAAMRIRHKQVNYVPTSKEVYDLHLKSFDPPKYARILCHYQWLWLYRPNGFIIGDNPLIRRHKRKGNHDTGVNHSNVEITMPLGSHLCILMRKRWRRYDGRLIQCSARLAKEYNRRQRLAAISYVYHGSCH